MASRLFIALFALCFANLGCSLLLNRCGGLGRSTSTRLQSAAEGGSERTFANYVIYKSKAAVALKVIPPTYQTTGRSKTVSREGGLLFEFALSSGPKEYDWLKKGTFLLAAAECGELLVMDSTSERLEFFHDPNMGGENAGQITKKLKFTRVGKIMKLAYLFLRYFLSVLAFKSRGVIDNNSLVINTLFLIFYRCSNIIYSGWQGRLPFTSSQRQISSKHTLHCTNIMGRITSIQEHC